MSGGEDRGADRLRIDRWLWCVRFFKSRSAAAEAVRAGRVRLNGGRVKPAHDVKPGRRGHDRVWHARRRARGDDRRDSCPPRAAPARRRRATSNPLSPSSAGAPRPRRVRLRPPPPTPGRPDKRTRRLLLRARDRR